MVELKQIEEQLKAINFKIGKINRPEILELEHILHEDEKIAECVSGFYEGGVGLLVATDLRVLLIDKKPMGFLNVDDIRFDNINDIDYSHRMIGAQISISCGMKTLFFKSYNQPRLRNLITKVQHRISEIKQEQYQQEQLQKQHLENINKQLQTYLLAQHQQLEQHLAASSNGEAVKTIKPAPQLADYLFAQRLLENFNNSTIDSESYQERTNISPAEPSVDQPVQYINPQQLSQELVEAGREEVAAHSVTDSTIPVDNKPTDYRLKSKIYNSLDVRPIQIAYAKLPYLLRTRRYRKNQPSNLRGRATS